MKKLLFTALTAATLMGSAVSAATFNIINHAGVNVEILVPNNERFNKYLGAGDTYTVTTPNEINVAVQWAGYGKNSYGSWGDNNEYNLNVWQLGLGNYAITIDKVTDQ